MVLCNLLFLLGNKYVKLKITLKQILTKYKAQFICSMFVFKAYFLSKNSFITSKSFNTITIISKQILPVKTKQIITNINIKIANLEKVLHFFAVSNKAFECDVPSSCWNLNCSNEIFSALDDCFICKANNGIRTRVSQNHNLIL